MRQQGDPSQSRGDHYEGLRTPPIYAPQGNMDSNLAGFVPPFVEVIWPTLGTPLSDATEEKNWRKMLHRGIFTRNRDPANVEAGEHWCRMELKCEESMLHLVESRFLKT